jgi:LuxR family maltose regulon positive regulatory protein
LDRLLHSLPPGNCVVIASRAAAPFSTGRLRIERALVEIGTTDLAMDVGEARAIFAAAGIEADEDQIGALVARTEGWAAGLSWATMAMQETPDTGSFVEAIDALEGGLSEYLIEEVLDQRPPELRAFMLDTSILARFNAALCDELRGRDDSRTHLDELDRTNSFLVPLDRRGEWFRYHHLVHDVLAARLERESPSTVPTLYRRASSWLHENDEVAESIRHARAAGDHVVAADILCGHWWEMVNGGRIETVHSLFEEFGSAEICAYQPLAIAAGLLYSLAGDHQQAQVFVRAAERGRHEGRPPDGSASIESSLAIMHSSLAFDGVDAMLAAGKRACELEPEDSVWRPLAELLVALGHIWRGELDVAEPELEDIIARAHADEAVVVDALAQLALIRLAGDDLTEAMLAGESACTLATETGLETVFVSAIAHGAAATAELAAGDILAANAHLDAALVPMAGVGAAMPIDAMQTRIVLANAAIQLGRLSEARRYIDDATRTRTRHLDTGILAGQLAAIAERLADTGEVAPAELSEREQAVLDLMPSESSIREIAEALYVSKETVKTHRRNIYRKLSVTTRADAVVAARRSGLLSESGH